jgi:hypothetical protein
MIEQPFEQSWSVFSPWLLEKVAEANPSELYDLIHQACVYLEGSLVGQSRRKAFAAILVASETLRDRVNVLVTEVPGELVDALVLRRAVRRDG